MSKTRAEAIADLHNLFGHPVRDTPTADIPDEERLLRAKLVLEEAVEFVYAMGCYINTSDRVVLHPEKGVDLVEAADALADISVVTEGSALSLGLDLQRVFDIVHDTNMAKVGPDGELIRADDGKILKPQGWVPPTEKIKAYLFPEPEGDPCTNTYKGEKCLREAGHEENTKQALHVGPFTSWPAHVAAPGGAFPPEMERAVTDHHRPEGWGKNQ